ncbi:GyrI-like domain-containing protein [Halobacillus halophilus]|uniref:GyrI-like domain-containing protein n=1 Tax=Halobacillus halophilus TaxID=1570 RepID=UPI001CD71FE0|nr:GyrI-like domain-containing protein [Halobacillus halophilus]MCA1010595.1 GyrI-like domain-containing protein [Halobacillus halophilus]
MNPAIILVEEKKLIGKSMRMSLEEDFSQKLWKSFMPHRHSIPDRVDDLLYNVKVFDQPFDPEQFNASTTFVKWAAVEVSQHEDEEAADMETYLFRGGLYAMFFHHGPASGFNRTLQYIFEEWLPSSSYELDDREHFERLTEDYHPNDPEAVEEVWVPIRSFVSRTNRLKEC